MEWQILAFSLYIKAKKDVRLGCDLFFFFHCKKDTRCIALPKAPVSINQVWRQPVTRSLVIDVWTVGIQSSTEFKANILWYHFFPSPYKECLEFAYVSDDSKSPCCCS